MLAGRGGAGNMWEYRWAMWDPNLDSQGKTSRRSPVGWAWTPCPTGPQPLSQFIRYFPPPNPAAPRPWAFTGKPATGPYGLE